MKSKTWTLLLLLTQIKSLFADEICCCPDLSKYFNQLEIHLYFLIAFKEIQAICGWIEYGYHSNRWIEVTLQLYGSCLVNELQTMFMPTAEEPRGLLWRVQLQKLTSIDCTLSSGGGVQQQKRQRTFCDFAGGMFFFVLFCSLFKVHFVNHF